MKFPKLHKLYGKSRRLDNYSIDYCKQVCFFCCLLSFLVGWNAIIIQLNKLLAFWQDKNNEDEVFAKKKIFFTAIPDKAVFL